MTARDIIFISLAGSVGDYMGAHTVISRRKIERICDGQVGGCIVFIRVPNSLQGCDGWGEGRGILLSKLLWSSGKIYAIRL